MLENPLRVGTRIEDHPDVRHAALRLFPLLSLLTHTRRVDADITHRSTPRIVEPVPRLLAAEPTTLTQVLDDPLSRRFGRPLNRRFAQPNPRRFSQQIRPLLKTVRDRSTQSRQPLHRRRQTILGQADTLVPGAATFPAHAAVVVGPTTGDHAAEAFDRLVAVALETGGTAALRAVDGRANVATFWGRCSA